MVWLLWEWDLELWCYVSAWGLNIKGIGNRWDGKGNDEKNSQICRREKMVTNCFNINNSRSIALHFYLYKWILKNSGYQSRNQSGNKCPVPLSLRPLQTDIPPIRPPV